MKRPSPDQLRQEIENAAFRIDRGHGEYEMVNLAMMIAKALVNISESLEDIAADTDRL